MLGGDRRPINTRPGTVLSLQIPGRLFQSEGWRLMSNPRFGAYICQVPKARIPAVLVRENCTRTA